MAGVHLLLVVLETHSELGGALAGAPRAGSAVAARAALALGVGGQRILKVLQPDLEHALTVGEGLEKRDAVGERKKT